MLTLIHGGEVFAPEPLGKASIVLVDGKIGRVGQVDRRALEGCGLEVETVDASGCLVVPGFIDPHQHLLGGSGEDGFSTQTPEFFIGEIVRWGITSVVGVLGVDTTMKTMAGLLGKVKALKEEGLNAWMWSGGYNVPPTSVMSTVRDDILYLEEVIGAGEIAVSDLRGLDPPPYELARVATDAHVGGMLARKCGLLHVHVGDRPSRLEPLRRVLEDYNVEPGWLYPTHVQRDEKLFAEAVALAKNGTPCDLDVMERDLAEWLRVWLDAGAPPELITASSDAAISSPRVLYEELKRCVRKGFPLELVLSLVTKNTATILKLEKKGTLEKGKWGDVVLMEKGSLEIVRVLSKGVDMVRDGSVCARERFLEESNRRVELVGRKQE